MKLTIDPLAKRSNECFWQTEQLKVGTPRTTRLSLKFALLRCVNFERITINLTRHGSHVKNINMSLRYFEATGGKNNQPCVHQCNKGGSPADPITKHKGAEVDMRVSR